MKKISLIIVLIFLLSFSANSDTKLQWNKTYSGGEIMINRIKFNLPDGEWLLIQKNGWTVSTVVYTRAIFVKEENNVFKEIFEAAVVDAGGKWIGHVDTWLQGEMFSTSNSDGCRDKIEYYFVKRKKRSASFNCFIIRHEDVQKEVWNPDKSSSGISKPFNTSWVRKWVRDKNIILPIIMLTSDHYFYDKNIGYSAVLMSHSINPEFYKGPKTQFQSEDNSEYHKYNIEKYPKVKKYMDNFVKQAIYKHQEFERLVKTKDNFKLNFDEFNLKNKSNIKSNSGDFINKINALKKLFDDGVLTKEEFAKAKKKLLN
jgi:hypothetical protein